MDLAGCNLFEDMHKPCAGVTRNRLQTAATAWGLQNSRMHYVHVCLRVLTGSNIPACTWYLAVLVCAQTLCRQQQRNNQQIAANSYIRTSCTACWQTSVHLFDVLRRSSRPAGCTCVDMLHKPCAYGSNQNRLQTAATAQ
jgi:hypothetical protein